MRSPAKPRRPFKLTLDKVLLGLYYLADDSGVVRATEAEIARPSHVGARSMQSALEVLEDRGFIRAEYRGGTNWTVTLLDGEFERSKVAPQASPPVSAARPAPTPMDSVEPRPVQQNFAWWQAQGQ